MFSLKEKVDIKDVNFLLKYDLSSLQEKSEGQSYNSFLESYKREIKRGQVTKTYEMKDCGFGRLYPNGISAVYMPSLLRNYLFKGMYNDLDIINCHPTLLLNKFNEYKLKCNNLELYVMNKDSILKEYNFSKKDFMKVMYSADFQGPLFFKEINNDIQDLIEKLKKDYRDVYEYSEKYKSDNLEGSFLAYILQDTERKIILKAKEYISKKNIKIGAVIYDGLMYEKALINHDDLSSFIFKEIGQSVKFKDKEMACIPLDNLISNDKNLLKNSLSNSEKYVIWKAKFEEYFFYMQIPNLYYCTYYDSTIQMSSQELLDRLQYNPKFMELYNCEIQDTKCIDIWLLDPFKKSYEKIDFIPRPLKCPDEIYNLFKGFDRDNNPAIENEEAWDIYERYKDHLASGSKEVKDFLIQKDIQMISSPGLKTGVIIAIVGDNGTGKGTNNLLKTALIGTYNLEVKDIGQITGRFNSIASQKIEISYDEADSESIMKSISSLKHLSTSNTINIELKGKEIYVEQFFANFQFSSQNLHLLKIEPTDRRIVVVQPPIISKELADDVYKLLGSEDMLDSLFHKLKNSKLKYKTVAEWQKARPVTEIYKDMKKDAVPFYIRFLHDTFKQDGNVEWSTIMHQYDSYCDENKYDMRYRDGKNGLSQKLTKIPGITSVRWKMKNISKHGLQFEINSMNLFLNKYEFDEEPIDLGEFLANF